MDVFTTRFGTLSVRPEDELFFDRGLVSPRCFAPDYQLRVDRVDLRSLELDTLRDAEVVVIASRQPSGLTLNLRAPLVINVEKRLGCQVIAKDLHPVQFPLSTAPRQFKRSA